MNGNYLLDTNIVIGLFARDRNILEAFKSANEILIPCIVVGELYYGAYRSTRRKENIEKIENFIAQNTILDCDMGTARWYGEIKNDLRQKGRPLPENDIWISALALQYNLVLVSQDNHFDEVKQLNKVQW